ncbi:YegS/Rv2252/BmrU family lipid kinase [Clostridium swellfunianum]|uniref:YegS/Rv2252/BmrU family lipid kinase n=1 Tax=Clostridium swellfunianum TaxID=1367462 RepID=UPI002030E8DC|nr:YegS/Rv2252/BmrU family lipid kinase [Clostridium swellfunianum]MCM0646842.1 YegS/Rv2252/BmrU family lipid kinase [Clostridium swellfunianum]
MNKVKFIYNPFSGENTIIADIDKVISVHQKYNYTVVPFRISLDYDISKAFDDIDNTYKYILVAGGDGTVDNVVNHMKQLNINIPIAVLPTGTANDFAKFLGMPHEVELACEQILNSQVKNVDIGKINDKYFVNVASTGLFTDISQKTSVTLKNTMGKLAYYVKGIEQLPNFKKLKIKVTSKEVEYDGDMYLMLIFNGQTAGNLKFAYKAEVDDGYLDVIIMKAGNIKDMVALLIQMLKGEHLDHAHNLIYFKTDKVYVECHEDLVTDIDGERGPDFPLTIECIKGGLEILGLKNN